MKNEKIRRFFSENKIAIITVFLLGIITYAIKLTKYSISIDTEYMINAPEALLTSWISIGRYGLVFFKRILNLVLVNIYITNIVAFLFLFISIIIWMYNIYKITNKNNKIGNILLGGIIITSPIIVEQFNFTLQCVEISLAMVLLSTAFTIINNWVNKKQKNILMLIPALAFIVLSFGCYQSFVPLYILFTTFSFLLIYKIDETITWKESIIMLLKYILIFIISFVIYKGIDALILKCLNISSTAYLNNQIFWGKEPKIETVKRIIRNVGETIVGIKNKQYNCGMLICCIMFLIHTIKNFKLKNWILYIDIIMFILAPFMLTILLGGGTVVRTQTPLVFATAMGTYYLYTNINKKIFKNIIIVIFIGIIVYQAIISILLFYTDYNVYKQEVNLLNEIEEKIVKENLDSNKPIIYTGKYTATGEKIILKGETMGATFLEWDNAGIVGSNYRIGGLLETLGIKHKSATVEQIAEAIKKAIENNMPKYPDDNSIIELDEYIIVNLGY